MIEDMLLRSKEQLGYFWRAVAPVPVANVVYTAATHNPDIYLYARCCIVLVLLARFSIGNYNYAAAMFASNATWFVGCNAANEIRKRFAWDAVLFALQLVTLTGMALSVTRPHTFYRVVEIFLLVDVLFLVFDPHAWPQFMLWLSTFRRANVAPETESVLLIRVWPAVYAPRTWVCNNLTSAMLLVTNDAILQYFQLVCPEALTVVLVICCAINTLVDVLRALRHM